MRNIMTKEELKQYLKDNLKLSVDSDEQWSGNYLIIELMLGDEVIDSTRTRIYGAPYIKEI
jgi:hypothetical protein